MGKVTGFIEWPRELPPKRDKKERLHDFKEFILPLAPEQAKAQAGRCMDCGVPTCHGGCPLGNLIPDFNDHVFHGRWRAAYAALARTNNFPEFTGRLCPAPCEAACVLGLDGAPVVIEQLEKEIIERAFAEGWVVPGTPMPASGKSVAVVGSGPAGLAAAEQLNQAGHSVTVYERDDALGGLLRYGIPDFKMEKSVIDRRLALLEQQGVVFRTGVDVGGPSLPWQQLQTAHDAVLIAIGSRRPRELSVPGAELTGVVQALLTRAPEPAVGLLQVLDGNGWHLEKRTLRRGLGAKPRFLPRLEQLRHVSRVERSHRPQPSRYRENLGDVLHQLHAQQGLLEIDSQREDAIAIDQQRVVLRRGRFDSFDAFGRSRQCTGQGGYALAQ